MVHQLTKSAYEKLVAELNERETKVRREITEQIREAREFGDLSENAAYKEAREAEIFNEARLEHIKNVLKGAALVKEGAKSAGRVQIGAYAELSRGGQPLKYQIVDTEEANPSQGKISSASPLGKSLLGKKVGEEVKVEAPRGTMVYKIISIS